MGRDYFNVTSSPPLLDVYTNQSNLPVQFSGLSRGTEYSFTVTVSNWLSCVNRADALTSTTASACTEPDGPQLSGLYHTTTNNSITINANEQIVQPITGQLDAFALNHTNPTGGISSDNYTSVNGGIVIITGLSPGTVYTAYFYGILNRTSCGGVVTGGPSGIGVAVNRLCTAPSSPEFLPGALSSTKDTITLSIDKVLSPVGELRDTVRVTNIIQHPGGQKMSDDGWASGNASDITIGGLIPGTSYTLYIIATLGDGNTSCDTNQEEKNDSVLRSPPSMITGCTHLPTPKIRTTGINSTAIGVGINNTFRFDMWSATLEGGNGTVYKSLNYTTATDMHIFSEGVTPAGGYYTVRVTFYLGVMVEDGTDCGDMGTLTSTANKTDAIVGCDEPPIALIDAAQLPNNSLEVSVNNPSPSFDIWTVSIQSQLTQTLHSYNLTSKQSHIFPGALKGVLYNINVTLVNVGGGPNCGLYQSKLSNQQMSYCTAPDHLNTTSLQFGSENGSIYFSGISGVLTGSYDSIHYSLSSSVAHCDEQYQATIDDINQRQVTDTLPSGCTYDLELWAQCGDIRGPSYIFYVYVPGDLNTTITETGKNATSVVYLLEDLLSVQATLKTVTCEDLQFGSNCSDEVTVNNISSDRSQVSVGNLTPGGFYQFVFEFSVGIAEGVHYETQYACLDPLDNLDWWDLGINSSTYDITAIPTKCPVSTQSLQHLPDSPLNLSLLVPGCEFRLTYSTRCVLPNGTAINSEQVEHRDTFCSDPAPSASLILASSTERELIVSGFGVISGYYDSMQVTISTDCMKSNWNNTLYTNDTLLEITGLTPGCRYWLNYKALCFASIEDNNGMSQNIMSTVSDRLCTVPRKPELQTIKIEISPTNSTETDALYQFGPISPNSVESVEGYISHFKLQSDSSNSLIDNISAIAANVSQGSGFVQVFPASEVRLSIEGVIDDCGGVSSNEVATFTLCSQPEAPSNLQLAGVDFTSFTLSWAPPETGTMNPIFYEVSVTQYGETSPILIQNVSAIEETPSSTYLINTNDANGISLPSATQFTCSVRTIIPYSCDYEQVFGSVHIDNSFSIATVPCATNGTGGLPSRNSYTFLTPSIVQINWTVPDDFVGVLDSDYYSVRVNGEEQRQVPANRQDLSTVVEGLDLCSNYSVTLVPVRSGLNAQTVQFDIRNWSNDAMVAETLSRFTEQVMFQCGVCPNDDLNNMCEFPFDHNEITNITTCIPFTRGGDLKCKDRNGRELTCYSEIVDRCKPEPPALETATFKTLVEGEAIQLTWFVSSEFYDNFQVYIKGELMTTTMETEFNATNMIPGEDYDIKIVMNSYGRQSEQLITFTMTDSPQNVFASDMTTTSAQLNFDPFDALTDPNSNSSHQNCTTEKLQVSQKVSRELDYVTLFWSEQELLNQDSVETIDVANSFTMQNLSSGIFYCFEVTPIDNCTGEVNVNSTLTICAPTVPVQLTEETNNLSLSEDDSNEGIQLHLKLNVETAAEIIHVDVTCVATIAIIIQSDGALLITVIEEQLASQNNTECRVFDCVDSQNSLDREVITADQREPGISCTIEIYSSTGVSESEHTRVARYETPNPIENLFVYFVDETSIRVSWEPPSVGYFDHFIVTVTSLDQTAHHLNISAKIDGYLRYVATDLRPGFNYQVSVYSAADPEGTIASQANVITQDTAPVPPESLTITEPENALRTIRLTFDPPTSGKFGGFLIEVKKVEDEDEQTRRTRRSLNGGILEDSQVELPLRVDRNETSVELTFGDFGSVFSVSLRSLSPNDKPSIASATQDIMTGIEDMGVTIHDVIKNSAQICFVWELTNTTNEVLLNRIRVELNEEIFALRQSESSVITAESAQEGVGLKCVDFVHNYTEENMTMEITMSKYHEATGLSRSASPMLINWTTKPAIEFFLQVSSICGANFCDVNVTDNKLPHRDKFTFNLKVSKYNTEGSLETHSNQIFAGSDCDETSVFCILTLTQLDALSNYSVDIEIELFGIQLPVVFTEEFATIEESGSDDDGVEVFIIILAWVGGIILLSVLIVAIVCCCRRNNSSEEEQLSPVYGRGNGAYDYMTPMPSHNYGAYIKPDLEYKNSDSNHDQLQSNYADNTSGYDGNISITTDDFAPNGGEIYPITTNYFPTNGGENDKVYPTNSGSSNYIDPTRYLKMDGGEPPLEGTTAYRDKQPKINIRDSEILRSTVKDVGERQTKYHFGGGH